MELHNPTPAVSRAVEAAGTAAQRRGADAIAPRDLFEGLLAEREGRAAVLLARHGFDLTSWPHPPNVPHGEPSDNPPLSSEAQSAFRCARELARSWSEDGACSTELLLLAVLQTDAVLGQQLIALGVNIAGVEQELLTPHAAPLELVAPYTATDSSEPFDVARILDANANRGREALRVLEDYCRFVLDDALLSRELKELRHGLTEVLEALPSGLLLAARDTDSDVGTDISTPREQRRYSTHEVLLANVKRLQEALRTLEEYGKLYQAELGLKLETLRYRTYTLERMLLLGDDARTRLAHARLYVLLSAASCKAALDWTIAEAAAGGADVIQLREKGLPDRELIERAHDVRRWTRKARVLFIVNDRPDIARLADADGVHLGQDDLSVRAARRILGPDALIGVSTHTIEQVCQAVRDGASYIGVGPTFTSTTKDFAELAGLQFVRAASAETSLPAFVLGGVTAKNIAEVVAAGGRRVAVSAAIAQADIPRAAAATLRSALPE